MTIDFLIIGAGSAGCVLANRLSEEASSRVLVVEAGRRPPWWDFRVHMPAALTWPLNGRTYNWGYQSDPEPRMDGRRVMHPRGKGWGGSSSINGMIFVRGHPGDFARWAARPGLEAWRYEHCLPYFRKMETWLGGSSPYRGDSGPLAVSVGAGDNPLFEAWLQAGQQAGYPYTEDYNGRSQEGVCRFDMTVHRGRRMSTARAYLQPALNRPNLEIRDRTLVARILFDGTRAVGVETAGGEKIRAGQVILCGGAFNSPQLLQLSGVGPADVLRDLGIRTLSNLDGVGRNLQDHLEIYLQQACTRPVSLYPALKPWRQALIGLEWYLFNTGPGATNHFEAGGFVRSNPDCSYPNLQFHFLPVAIRYDGTPQKQHGFQAHVGPMRSDSRGRVVLRSADHREAPSILFNYLSTEQDRREWVEAVEKTREIFAQPAFDAFRGEELSPGPDVRSAEQVLDFVRRNAESAYHPCGTCRMGEDDGAVVDASLRVRGVENLAVVDASVFPEITNGNINAPVIMVAEKAADIILGREPLPPQAVEDAP
ncbi:MAG: choline dehydrogenase [Gammaproteobacteria bacterium]|nr:choline dehydrogenase [Gammaproteobacteria bacterium]